MEDQPDDQMADFINDYVCFVCTSVRTIEKERYGEECEKQPDEMDEGRNKREPSEPFAGLTQRLCATPAKSVSLSQLQHALGA